MAKVEHSDSRFVYYSDEFEGLKITLRVVRATGEVQILLDDNFAKANGYKDVGSLVNSALLVNGMPVALASRWLSVGLDGSFTAIGMMDLPQAIGEA